MLDLKKAINNILTTLITLPGLTNNSIKVVTIVSLAASGSISSGGVCDVKSKDVSSSIPNGYKLIFACMRGTQNSQAVCWFFDWYGTTIYYRLRNVGSGAINTTPTANLLLVRVGG